MIKNLKSGPFWRKRGYGGATTMWQRYSYKNALAREKARAPLTGLLYKYKMFEDSSHPPKNAHVVNLLKTSASPF